MKLSRMVYLLRLELVDEQKVGFPNDDELIEYLDRAASFLTDRMITMRYNSLIKYITLDGPTELPADFVTFVGKVPVQIVGNTATVYSKVDKQMPTELWYDPNIPDDDKRLQWGGKSEEYVPWEELTKTDKITVIYWSRLPFPSTFVAEEGQTEQELPYKPDEARLVMELARMFALNRLEYDLTQDLSIMSQIQQAMAQARGTADATDGGQ
jgi:hypothetical protein